MVAVWKHHRAANLQVFRDNTVHESDKSSCVKLLRDVKCEPLHKQCFNVHESLFTLYIKQHHSVMTLKTADRGKIQYGGGLGTCCAINRVAGCSVSLFLCQHRTVHPEDQTTHTHTQTPFCLHPLTYYCSHLLYVCFPTFQERCKLTFCHFVTSWQLTKMIDTHIFSINMRLLLAAC